MGEHEVSASFGVVLLLKLGDAFEYGFSIPGRLRRRILRTRNGGNVPQEQRAKKGEKLNTRPRTPL